MGEDNACKVLNEWHEEHIKYYESEIEKLQNIVDDKKERIEIAIRLLLRMFGTDDYEINYVMGILNGDRQIHFDDILDKEEK